jgi:hypothetical protein
VTLTEIKQAIEQGRKVYWSSLSYEVIKDNIGQYLICYNSGKHYIGLTWQDGVTLNGKESDFFTIEK